MHGKWKENNNFSYKFVIVDIFSLSVFNRLLTLPSGWRIQFTDNVNFIFETHDLIHASPATISRMGIVNLR